MAAGQLTDSNTAATNPFDEERSKVKQTFVMDEELNPVGGYTGGEGFSISWPQISPHNPNNLRGAYLTEVLTGLIGRLEFYQTTKFQCWENGATIAFLKAAKGVLEDRANKRKDRGVFNTHNV